MPYKVTPWMIARYRIWFHTGYNGDYIRPVIYPLSSFEHCVYSVSDGVKMLFQGVFF